MLALIRRNLLDVGREALDLFPVLLVQGAQQVGKSTFAQMLMADRPHRQLTLDDSETLRAALDDPRGFAAQYPGESLLVDEVQRAPGLLLAIKAAIDNDRAPGRYVLTGSSDLLRLSKAPDSLAGRAITLNLSGLSQGEIAGVKDDFAHWIRRRTDSPQGVTTLWRRSNYAQAFAEGGYPEARRLNGRWRGRWIDSYLERVLTRDVLDVSPRLAPERVGQVLRLIAANQGGELVKDRLANQLGTAASTVGGYVETLRTLYLVEQVKPWTPNLTSRQVGRRKTAVADSALAMRLAGVQPGSLEALTASESLGALMEAFAAAELAKQRTWSEEDFNLDHFRDRDGLEVDLVIEYGDGQVFLIEVKATQTFRPAHTKGIRALAAKLGERFLGGAVLGVTEHGYLLGDRIYGLPLSALWEAR